MPERRRESGKRVSTGPRDDSREMKRATDAANFLAGATRGAAPAGLFLGGSRERGAPGHVARYIKMVSEQLTSRRRNGPPSRPTTRRAARRRTRTGPGASPKRPPTTETDAKRVSRARSKSPRSSTNGRPAITVRGVYCLAEGPCRSFGSLRHRYLKVSICATFCAARHVHLRSVSDPTTRPIHHAANRRR